MAFDPGPVRERQAEQLLSDERLLGAAPEDAVRVVLDDALARLDQAAARATSEAELDAAFQGIRAEARTLLDDAAGQDDAAAYVRSALSRAHPATETAVSAASAGAAGVPAADAPGVDSTDETHAAVALPPEPPAQEPPEQPESPSDDAPAPDTWPTSGAGDAALPQDGEDVQTDSSGGRATADAPARDVAPDLSDVGSEPERSGEGSEPEDPSLWQRVRGFGHRLNPFD